MSMIAPSTCLYMHYFFSSSSVVDWLDLKLAVQAAACCSLARHNRVRKEFDYIALGVSDYNTDDDLSIPSQNRNLRNRPHR